MSYIPTLEGDEAEEFVRKADENVKAMKQRNNDSSSNRSESK